MRTAAFLILAGSCLALRAAEVLPMKLVQTIPLPGVKGRFDHFAIDPKGNRLFVAALGNSTLEVIDLAAGKRIQSVPGMSKPTGILYLPESNQILVANGEDGTLKFLDGSSYKVSQTLRNLPDADNLRFDAKTKLAFIGYGDGSIGAIDLAVPKVIAVVKLDGHPESFQLEKQGPRMFVNVPAAKQVAVLGSEKRSVIHTWPMGKFQANFPMALDEANHRLFAGCRNPARLVVVDTASGQPVTDLAISGDTDDLFYDAKRKRLYISCGEGFIDVVEQCSPNSYQRLTRIPSASGARTSFFSPDLDCLYLAVPDRGSQKAEIRVYQPE
jgi:WD40 repeat protein